MANDGKNPHKSSVVTAFKCQSFVATVDSPSSRRTEVKITGSAAPVGESESELAGNYGPTAGRRGLLEI